ASICSRSGRSFSNPKTTRSGSAPSKSWPRCATRAPPHWPTSRSRLSSISIALSLGAQWKEQRNDRSFRSWSFVFRETDERHPFGLCAEGRGRWRLRLGVFGFLAHARSRSESWHARFRSSLAGRQPLFKDLSVSVAQKILSAFPAPAAVSRQYREIQALWRSCGPGQDEGAALGSNLSVLSGSRGGHAAPAANLP